MTGLLASVRSSAEAELALATGADIIDLKEPQAGSLGALPPDVVRDCVTLVAGRRPVSATIGDLPADPDVIAEAVARTAALGVDFVKIGIFPGGAPEAVLDVLRHRAASGTRLVALLFADREPDFGLVRRVAECGFAGVMLDTMGKDGRGLRDALDQGTLRRFVDQAHDLGLLAGLAGSLRLKDIPALAPLGADYLGFRGALCRGERTGDLDPEALREVRAALDQASRNSKATATAGAESAAASLTSSSPSTTAVKSA